MTEGDGEERCGEAAQSERDSQGVGEAGGDGEGVGGRCRRETRWVRAILDLVRVSMLCRR